MGRDDRLTFNPSGQVKALRFSSIASGWWDGLEESHNTFRDVIIPGFKIQQVTRAVFTIMAYVRKNVNPARDKWSRCRVTSATFTRHWLAKKNSCGKHL